MVIDINRYKKNKYMNNVFHTRFFPVVREALEGENINTKLFCAAYLLFSTATAIFKFNMPHYSEEKLQEEKKEYLLLLKELAEDVKNVWR